MSTMSQKEAIKLSSESEEKEKLLRVSGFVEYVNTLTYILLILLTFYSETRIKRLRMLMLS